MATHSSVPAWRIPGTGEPGGLPSMGSHRVRHDWSDLAAAAAAAMFYFVYICVSVCIFIVSISIHPSINEHIGYFQFVAIINNNVRNMEVQISLCTSKINENNFIYFGSIPRSGISESYVSSILILWRTSILFHCGYINLHSHQQCTKVFLPPHLLSLGFLIRVTVTGERWYLTAVLICISLMISDVENVTVSHLYIFFGKKKIYSGPFPILKSDYLIFLLFN